MKRYPRSRQMTGRYIVRSGRSSRRMPTEKTRARLEHVVNLLQRLAIEQPTRMLALDEIIQGMLDGKPDPESGAES